MCTLTVVTNNETYRAAMNRDEKISRSAGLPLETYEFCGDRAIYPGDGSGGTWIATNEYGITLALLNWSDVTASGVAPAKTRSRGQVVPALIGSRSLSDLRQVLRVLDFKGMLPLRLVGVFPSERQIWEWRCATRLEFQVHAWESRHWFSSSLSDERAETVRGAACRSAQCESDTGSVPWLRRLHASHADGHGPFSMCVHRQDVKTLSYTEVMVTPGHIQIGHFRGSPCTMGPIQEVEIERTPRRESCVSDVGTAVILNHA